ncbi:MAG: hypothetical protein LBR65_04090 [Culturomica sp.]|jgi:hypothetical protein|nr:hypothetical protein [Culturomica sp.]
MELAKIISTHEIDLRFCPKEHTARMAELTDAGFLPFANSKQPQAEAGYVALDSYEVKGGKVVQSWVVVTDPTATTKRIEELKEQLSSSDYMITKCMEAQLIGAPLPYDVDALHAERQAIRDEINRMEELL